MREVEPGVAGRASNTDGMAPASIDPQRDVPEYFARARVQLAILETARHDGDTHAASGAAWMLRTLLASVRTLLDAADDPSLEGHHQAHADLVERAEPLFEASPVQIAERATRGSGGPLPFAERIQASFGRHDVSGIQAHVGGAAQQANHELGAHGFAFGRHVAFARGPDLHTAAHEAAHVIQQSQGIALKSRTGQPDDAHEHHADAVADAVVRGESAEPLLDQAAMPGGAGSTSAAVQFQKRDHATPTSAKSPNGEAPDLAGAPYRWVPGTLNFWISTRWFKSASDFEGGSGQWASRSRIQELLGALRDNGMLRWTTPERIHAAASELTIEPSPAEVRLVRLGVSAYDSLGMPPGVQVLVGKRDGGLEVVVAVPGVDAPPGHELPLSQPHRLQLVTALEKFTSLAMEPAHRQRILDRDIRATMGAGTSRIFVDRPTCADLFGRDEFARFYDKKVDPEGRFDFDVVGGTEAYADLTPDEVDYVRKWFEANLSRGKAGGAVAVSRALLEALKKLDAQSEERRRRVLALLRGGKETKDESQLTSAVVDRAMQEAAFEEERELAGFKPESKGAAKKASRSPVFDVPIPARIDQHNGLVIANESVEFSIVIDWPPGYAADEHADPTWRAAKAQVDWMFERTLPDGRRHEERSSSIPSTLGTTHKLPLRPGEVQAIWTVHAFVRHSSFQPNHLVTQVEVKTEQKRLEEMRAQSFGQLGENHIDAEDYDFDTSAFNETLGDREYDHGKRFRGELPKDFAGRTPEQRKQTLADEIHQTDLMLQFLRKQGSHPEAVSAAEHYIAKLRDAQKSMDRDVVEGWRPFEVRGTFLGRGGRTADGPLDLFGAVRRTTFTMPSGAKVESVSVQIRDLSRRLEAENYRFDGKATTYEKALELAFVDLCKKYPGGTLSILAEGFEPDGTKPTGRTVGFELDTGTAWKDVKSEVFDPAVNVAVNIAAAVVMMIFPASIPIMLPATILYNETQNIDQMVDSWTSSTLTDKKVFVHIAQLGLDILPMLGRAPMFRTSRLSFAAFEIANLGGQAILMKEQVQETIRQIRDSQINDMAELYAKYVELEKSTHASDPTLVKMRGELDRRGDAIRKAAQDAWLEAAASFAIVAVPTHAVQMVDQHLTIGRRSELQASRRMVHVDDVDPHYDPRRGQIVGDQSRMDRATLDHLTKQQDAHMQDLAGHIADELGVSREKVAIRPADENRIWKDGDTIHVRYAPGTDLEAALATWRTQAKAAKIGAAHKKASPSRGTETPEPRAGRRAADDGEIIAETAKLDPDLAHDTSSQGWETTAAAVPGSTFRGNTHPANAGAVLAESRTAVTRAASRFGDVKSIEKVSTKHLDPANAADRDEKPRLDDTWLITPSSGAAFTIRVTTGPLGTDAVARTVVNPSKRGASFVERPGEHEPLKIEIEGRYVVHINDSIDPAHAERALSHEIAEILAERELAQARMPASKDLLRPGDAPVAGERLSPHDRGRIGELKALAAQVNAGDSAPIREMLALVEDLGLRDGTAGAAERRRLIGEYLADDPAAVAALDRVAKADIALEPELAQQLAHVRSDRDVHIAEAGRRNAERKPIDAAPDAGVAPGERVTLDRARELELEAATARARRSAETVADILARTKDGDYPEFEVQVGGGAGLAARDPNVLLIDARGRWQADASDRIAQTANQLRGLKDAGLGDPFQFAAPNERVPMSAIRFWEDSIAARGPVIDGHVTNISIDARGHTIVTIKVTNGPEIKVKAKGSLVMSPGFPVERMPGTPRGMTPDRAVDHVRSVLAKVQSDPKASSVRKAHAEKAMAEVDRISGLELQPGKREMDLAEVKKVLARHGFADEVKAQAKGAFDMLEAGDHWAKLREEHPDKFVLGDWANLETLDAHATDKWIIGGPGGTGISAAEIVLARNTKAHVTMIGDQPPPGLIENDQFVSVLRKHADPQTRAWFERRGINLGNESDNRFSLVLGIKDLGTPAVDGRGKVQVSGSRGGKPLPKDFVPEGYDRAHNPLTGGGGYIAAIGREWQLPPVAAALKDSVEATGGKMTMHMLWLDEQYLGYRLRAFGPPGSDGVAKELQTIDVTGAASRFPPMELMAADPAYLGREKEMQRDRDRFAAAQDFDAPPESGNFDGGFVASATQAARYAQLSRSRKNDAATQ